MLNIPTITLPSPGLHDVVSTTISPAPPAFRYDNAFLSPGPTPEPPYTLSQHPPLSPFPNFGTGVSSSSSLNILGDTFQSVSKDVQTEENSAVLCDLFGNRCRVIPPDYRRTVLRAEEKGGGEMGKSDSYDEDWVPFCVSVFSVEGLVEAEMIVTDPIWVSSF